MDPEVVAASRELALAIAKHEGFPAILADEVEGRLPKWLCAWNPGRSLFTYLSVCIKCFFLSRVALRPVRDS
jgi:hypothetical protein